MSTRSVIARPVGASGFEGQYAHWDGYPSWMARRLWEIVQRHGFDTASAELLSRSWSEVDPRPDNERVDVPGFGVSGGDDGSMIRWSALARPANVQS